MTRKLRLTLASILAVAALGAIAPAADAYIYWTSMNGLTDYSQAWLGDVWTVLPYDEIYYTEAYEVPDYYYEVGISDAQLLEYETYLDTTYETVDWSTQGQDPGYYSDVTVATEDISYLEDEQIEETIEEETEDDTDHDGTPDAQDNDDDNDGVADTQEDDDDGEADDGADAGGDDDHGGDDAGDADDDVGADAGGDD